MKNGDFQDWTFSNALLMGKLYVKKYYAHYVTHAVNVHMVIFYDFLLFFFKVCTLQFVMVVNF